MRPLVLAGIAVILAQAACSQKQTQAAAARVGEPAPDFSLTDTTGRTRALKDAKGKWVVLEWHNHLCPFVEKHYKSGNMQGLQKRYTAKGVVWYSIISSAPGKQGHVAPADGEALRKKLKAASTATLLDPSGEVGRAYGAKVTPHMYVISPEGVLLYNGAIDSVRSTDPADIPKATNYVAAALDAAMAGKPVPEPTTQPYGCSVKYQ